MQPCNSRSNEKSSCGCSESFPLLPKNYRQNMIMDESMISFTAKQRVSITCQTIHTFLSHKKSLVLLYLLKINKEISST
jgi:hypothetical protein